MTTTHLTQRAQRLLDEFQEGADGPYIDLASGYSVRHGIAAVLRHIADTEESFVDCDTESMCGVPTSTLLRFVEELTAPTLLDRAMAGDAKAARQFLHEAGFTDADGQLMPQYRTPES